MPVRDVAFAEAAEGGDGVDGLADLLAHELSDVQNGPNDVVPGGLGTLCIASTAGGGSDL